MSLPSIRAYQASDRSRCLEIFQANEDRACTPPGYLAEFEAFLENDQILKVLVERADSVAGVGGIQYWQSWEHAFLSFGLIHPDLHRQRLGSILLLSRLVLLEVTNHPISVYLQATDRSRPFFEKIGFGYVSADTDAHGSAFYDCRMNLTSQLHRQCADTLARSGIILPDDLAVPVASENPHFLTPPEA